MFALEQGRYTVAAGATGVIRASRDASVAYANERETFGTKIANHQLVKQKIADMEADYQMSRLLWLKAGWLKNEGQPSGRATSLAKWQATVRSEKAASMAIEVHGANGYTNDYPVERYLRNCKAAVIYEGTRDIHTLMQADWALGLKKEKPARVRCRRGSLTSRKRWRSNLITSCAKWHGCPARGITRKMRMPLSSFDRAFN